MKRKCILISEALWKKLMEIKLKNNFKTLEQTIAHFLNNSDNDLTAANNSNININAEIDKIKKEIDVIKARIEDLEERVFANP
mgnify:CR=1 FL=1